MVGTWTFDAVNNIETVTGATSGAPAGFVDAWDADVAGTRTLKAAAASPFTASLTTAVKPTEKLALKLSAVITAHSVNGTVAFTGKDAWGNAINETLNVTGNGIVTTTLYFASVDANGVVAVGTFSVAVTQPRWGVVWKQATNQFVFDCKIVVGNTGGTASYFTDTNKQITINSGIMTAAGQNWLYVYTGGHVTFGAVKDATTKASHQGCSFYSKEATYYYTWMYDAGSVGNRDTNLYSCSIGSDGSDRMITRAFRIWNFKMFNVGVTSISTLAAGDYFNINCENTYYAILASSATSTFNRITMLGGRAPLRLYGNNDGVVFKNVYARNCTYIFQIDEVTTAGLKSYVINVDSDTWAFWWSNSAGMTVFRQYEFDLTTTKYDGTPLSTVTNGVAVTLTKGATVINLTTDANGKITTQTLSKGYYDQANGNTIQDAGNWTLTVTATGYIPVTRVFSLDQKTSWMCAMHAQLAGDANVGDVASNKKFYKDDADTQLTGTLTQNAGGYVKVIKEKSKLEEPLLLLTANLIIQKQKSM